MSFLALASASSSRLSDGIHVTNFERCVAAWSSAPGEWVPSAGMAHYGIPCERWMRKLVNRVDPILFGRCLASWVAAVAGPARPHRHRRQDRTAHPRPPQGAQSPAHAQRLRDLGTADPGAARRAGKDQRDHRIPDLLDELAVAKQRQRQLFSKAAMAGLLNRPLGVRHVTDFERRARTSISAGEAHGRGRLTGYV
jgi:hypothetical protein